MIIKKIFDQLIGTWQMVRTFGTVGTGVGYAVFTPSEPNRLTYREDLTLSCDGQENTYPVYQDYGYHYDPHQNLMTKQFSNGRDFYPLIFDSDFTHATGTHRCLEDLYQAKYTFMDQQNFELIYRVTGPKKNYCLITQFTKLSVV